MRKKIVLGLFISVICVFFSLGITNTINAAVSGGGAGHPAFKSPMVNYEPAFVSNSSNLYKISYEFNVSGISNAKE